MERIKDLTNIEFVTELMEKHPLYQTIVIEAISRYANDLASQTDEEVDAHDNPEGGGIPLFSMRGFREYGKDIQSLIKEKYQD
jgi:hypothetical protein